MSEQPKKPWTTPEIKWLPPLDDEAWEKDSSLKPEWREAARKLAQESGDKRQ